MSVDPVATRRMIESLSTHMEDHLATWKSTLVDAKREIETLLTTLSDKIPAQAKPLFPEDIVGIMLEDAMPPAPPPVQVERIVEKIVERVVPGPSGSPDWSVARSALAAVESARTQVDVLTRFLTQANAHASRVALLVLRNDRLTGWKAIGFDASGGRDEAVKSVDLSVEEDPFASAVLKGERSMIAEPPDESSPLRRALGGRAPSRTVLIPMVIRDRLAGLLAADELSGEEGRLNESALEVLTFVTGLSVDLLAARKKIPSPSLTPTGEPIARYQPAKAAPFGDAGATRALSAVAPEPPRPAPTPPRPHQVGEPSAARPMITDAREALRALEESAVNRRRVEVPRPPMPPPARPAPARATPEELGLTTAIPTPAARPPAPPPPAPGPPPIPPQGAGDLTIAFEHLKTSMPAPPPAAPPRPLEPPKIAPPAPPPSAPVAPPAPAAAGDAMALGGSAAPLAPPAGFVPRSKQRPIDDSQRAVEDAKRLARLLVSEIKLYNERKVEEGRAAGDIYERLKDDIERSRQVYEERTPEAVRRGSDYFRDELVRILAEGKPDILGA